MNCIFCKIANKKAPAKVKMETKDLIVFEDISPSAPVHYLIVPKKHYDDFLGAPDDIWLKVKKVSDKLSVKEKLTGFRLITNAGDSALVRHMHVHFLGKIAKERRV